MPRPKKNGQRYKGIQGKSGYLYILISTNEIEDGVVKRKVKWISTGLKDNKENLSKAIEIRNNLYNTYTYSKKKSIYFDKNIVMEDLLPFYLIDRKRELADTTYAAYEYKSRHILEYFRNVRIRDITEVYIKEFLDSLFTDKNLSKRTVKDIRTVFCNIMDYAVANDIIHSNPVNNTEISKQLADKYSGKGNFDDDFFSYDEAMLFMEKIRGKPLSELFYLTLVFGLRREEVLGLRWSAIDFKNKLLYINHTVTKGTTVVRKNSTKTVSSNRSYLLTDDQITMLKNLKQKEKEYKEKYKDKYNDNDYIFKNEKGSPYYPDHPSKVFRKIIKEISEMMGRILPPVTADADEDK